MQALEILKHAPSHCLQKARKQRSRLPWRHAALGLPLPSTWSGTMPPGSSRQQTEEPWGSGCLRQKAERQSTKCMNLVRCYFHLLSLVISNDSLPQIMHDYCIWEKDSARDEVKVQLRRITSNVLKIRIYLVRSHFIFHNY